MKKATELHHMSKKWNDPRSAHRSPEYIKVWTEPPPSNNYKPLKVPVVYFLSENGNVEDPQFIEVPLSSSEGLYLKDVTNKLNSLRGKGMAALYSWAVRRSYKNKFVWQDLGDEDIIHPVQGQSCVLKGSALLVAGGASLSSKSEENVSSMSKTSLNPDSEIFCEDDFVVGRRRRNQSCSAVNIHEYKKVYTGESSAGKITADASTQTDHKRRPCRGMIREEEEIKESTVDPPGAYGKVIPGFSMVSYYKSIILPCGMGLRNTRSDNPIVEEAIVFRKIRESENRV